MTNKVERIVLDTNLFISFLVSNSFSKLEKQIIQGKICLLFSAELLEEFLTVVSRPKLRKYFSEKDISDLLYTMQKHAEFIEVKSQVNVCRDKKDNFLLALCQDGNADFLLTGDEDLLILKKHRKTIILKIADYLRK